MPRLIEQNFGPHEVACTRVMVRDLVNGIARRAFVPWKLRWLILTLWGVEIDRGALIYPAGFFGGTNIKIGASYLNRGVFIDNTAGVQIGDRCSIGMETLIVTSGHQIGDHCRRAGPSVPGPVVIQDGCWLGARVLVMPGVTIGAGCVIAGGALVTADCEPDGLYAGIPARRLRDL